MIGKLTGKIDSLSDHQLILDVQGVGYVVTASSKTLRQIGTAGDATSLLIETQVREDAISLFGFASKEERDWFRLLTTVQGVGAKVALAILSTLAPDALGAAIASQDKTTITQADGVGPKLALRLVTELKDKVLTSFAPTPIAGTLSNAPAPSNVNGEALSALVNLGYRRMEAFAAVTTASQKLGGGASLNDLIRVSLAEIGALNTIP